MDDDKSQIAEVLIRYATGIDSKDWPLFRTCWTDEVDVDYGEVGRYSGADAITGLMEQLHNAMGPTYHRLTNSRHCRRTVTARRLVRMFMPCSRRFPMTLASWVEALGHYDDELVRTPDGWRISRPARRVSRGCTQVRQRVLNRSL